MFKKMKTRKRLAALITLITLFAFSSVMTVMTAHRKRRLYPQRLLRTRRVMKRGKTLILLLR